MFNKIGKIVITCVFVCVLLIGLSASTIYAKTQNEDLTELMINLGIYDDADSMEFVNESITREEAAGILSVFFGVEEKIQATTTSFEDVPEYWASGHIMAMVDNGIMCGYDDGLFRPKNAVSVAQMVKILVNLTGYQVLAEGKGGYPQGYIYVASDIDMLDGINIGSIDREITKGEFTRMLYNALSVPLLEQVTFGENNEFLSNKQVTLLSQKLDIYETEGFVTALPYVSLDYNAPAGSDKIKIDDTVFYCYSDAYSYLGSYVKVYYRQTKNDTFGEIINISEDENESDYIIVSDKDIVSVSSGLDQFSYLDDGDLVKIKLDKQLMLIYNGKRMTYFTDDYLNPLQGYVKFCNTDSDGEYEFAIVENEVNYIVDKVSNTDGVISITAKNGKTPLVIDTEDNDVTYRVFNRGVKAYLSDIKENMVISVSADAMDLVANTISATSNIFNLTISELMINGTIDEISDEDISVDGVWYALAKECKCDDIKLGESYTVYLNYRSEIVGYDINPDEYLYGILHAGGYDGIGLSKEVVLKIFGEEGKLFTAKCSDKLKIDGYPEKKYGNAIEWLKTGSTQFGTITGIGVAEDGVWQLVRYSMNANGEISSIDTVLENRVASENDLEFFESYISNTYLAWNKGSGTLGGRYGVTDDVVIFEIGTNRETDDEYYILPLASYISTATPTYFFDANEMNVVSVAIKVLTDPSENVPEMESDSLMLFEKFKTKVNASGYMSEYICGYMLKTNEYAEIELADDSVRASASVKPGDFVRWARNTDGKPSKIEKSMSIDGTGIKTNASKPEGAFNTRTRLSYGKAMALDNEYIKVRYEGNKPYEEPSLYSRVKGVYIFDSEDRKYYESDMNSIRTAERYGEADADTIGMYSAEGVLWTVVIYR